MATILLSIKPEYANKIFDGQKHYEYRKRKIRVGLWIADNKERFDYMKQHKTEIEAAMGMALSWERLDNKKSSLICTYIKGLDFKNQENYPELMNKSIDLVVKMRDVLKEYVLAEL